MPFLLCCSWEPPSCRFLPINGWRLYEMKKLIAEVVRKEVIDKDDMVKIFALVKEHGGVEHSLALAKEYIARSKGYLDAFDDSPDKRALLDLADYIVTRVK